MNRTLLHSAALAVALTSLLSSRFRSVADPIAAASYQAVTPAFRDLFPADTQVEKLADGFTFTEGPLWNAAGFLLFTNPEAGVIYRWSPEAGVTTFRKPSNGVIGLTYDQERRLIACENGRITRTEADGKVTILTRASTNDVVVKSDGALYFTTGSSSVYRLGLDGQRTTVAKGFGYANGLAFSPDEKRLYVVDSPKGKILIYEVTPEGTLENGRSFASVPLGENQGPDGIKVDRQGNLYCASWGGGLRVFDSKGTHLGTVKVGEAVTNCAWGDADGKSLYLTALTSVYRVRVQTEGILP